MAQPRDERRDNLANSEGISRERAASLTLKVIVHGMVATLPFLRIGGGVDQPGMEALVMAVAMPCWAIETHSSLAWQYWQAWLLALVFYRLTKRKDVHSWFAGRCWLVGMFVKNHRIASFIEALLVLGGGYLVEDFGLRWLLMFSGASWLAHFMVNHNLAEKERIAFDNARHEMNAYADRMR